MTDVVFRMVDSTHPHARECLDAYARELNERAPQRKFDPGEGSTATPEQVQDPHGAFFLAYLSGVAVGCGGVKHTSESSSDIKRMWISPRARGHGVGRQLLYQLEQVARRRGSVEVRLETNDVLAEAIALYRSAGYVEVAAFNAEPFADRWFRKPLSPEDEHN